MSQNVSSIVVLIGALWVKDNLLAIATLQTCTFTIITLKSSQFFLCKKAFGNRGLVNFGQMRVLQCV